MRKKGFTLLELLVVIVVVGILATLVAAAAGYAVRTARQRRMEISCQNLRIAILRYRTEYNEWPGGDPGSVASKTFEGTSNKNVFGMLRRESDDNPDHIHFLDETAFFTPGGEGSQKLSETTGDQPLVCLSRTGRDYLYYKVVINYANETVSVSVPDFDDE